MGLHGVPNVFECKSSELAGLIPFHIYCFDVPGTRACTSVCEKIRASIQLIFAVISFEGERTPSHSHTSKHRDLLHYFPRAPPLCRFFFSKYQAMLSCIKQVLVVLKYRCYHHGLVLSPLLFPRDRQYSQAVSLCGSYHSPYTYSPCDGERNPNSSARCAHSVVLLEYSCSVAVCSSS